MYNISNGTDDLPGLELKNRFSEKSLRRIHEYLKERQKYLLEAWHEYQE